MQIEGRNIYDLEENVDYRTLKKSIEDKTGIRILQCKDMIFEKLSNTEKVATIDCTQSREDCRVTMEELKNGWKPAWEKESIKIIKDKSLETETKEQNKINENKIIINFGNIVSELETRNLKLCLRKNKVGMFIIDSENNMYNIEMYRSGSYLDQLIKDGIIVEFNYIEASLSKNIGEWEKEIWDVEKIKDFIQRQKINYQKQNIEDTKEESDIIDSEEICKTYFEFDNKIINGWKVIECDNTYEVYTYTSCKALGNWQLFLTFDDKETMLRYFRNQVNKTNDKLENEWCKTEHEWFVNTYDILNKKIA
jgi:hypothetical protein